MSYGVSYCRRRKFICGWHCAAEVRDREGCVNPAEGKRDRLRDDQVEDRFPYLDVVVSGAGVSFEGDGEGILKREMHYRIRFTSKEEFKTILNAIIIDACSVSYI